MNKLIYDLNRLWLLVRRSQFKEVKIVNMPDESKEEIIIFSKRDAYFAQVTPFNTITVAENIFSAPTIIRDSFLLHEKGHKRTPLVFRCVYIWPIAFIFFIQYSEIYLLSLVFLFAMHNWILEILAESYKARFLGKKKYDEIHLAKKNFFKGKIKRSKVGMISSILSRPPPKLFYWIINKNFE